MNKKPTALIILDGFGHNSHKKYNAIAQAKTPHIDQWFKEYPHTLLHASGEFVGLLPGMIGNSEVGHTIIGAGRVVPQPVLRIHNSIKDGSFFSNPRAQNCFQTIKKNNGALHIMGLLSDAGVHSHIDQLFAFLQAAHTAGIKKIYVHPFLDGRDAPPKSARAYLEKLDTYLETLGTGTIASLHGRFYAMDRDKNWERTQKSIDILTHKHHSPFKTWHDALIYFYEKGITDEFIPPTQLHDGAIIHPNDGIIFFNFRPDRARQLSQSLCSKYPTSCFLSPVPYNQPCQHVAMWPLEPRENGLLDTLHTAGKSVFAIAETEKYAHVSYFFAGGREQPYPNETRILIPSIPAQNYTQHPEMSAREITTATLDSLRNNPADFYLINYANADMVGHSGDIAATIKAIECLDQELAKLYDQIVEKMDGTIYLTADHGNAEEMFDETTNQPRTAHTTNKVPFIIIQKDLKNSQLPLPLSELANIAPYILRRMQITIPASMNSKATITP